MGLLHSFVLAASRGPARPPSIPPDVTLPAISGGVAVRVRPRILFVDDEPMILKSLAATLRKHFEVISGGSGQAALDILARDPGLRVVVSDYRMPGMDGGVFLAQVRERFPEIVRILLSGAGAAGGIAANPELVFRFLPKPCPRQTLIDTIEEALALSSGAPTRN
ncbi:MAG: response regulator [Polyangiaceae bacterium]|jgi:DNA-binding NtrC family response regulator